MDVKFDVEAAESLIMQMDKYCTGVQKETRELLNILQNSGEWNDNQMKAFYNNICEMSKDLNQALSLEGEYMRTYYQRVKELRG